MKQLIQVQDVSPEDLKREISDNVTKRISEVLAEFMKDLKSKQEPEFITSKEAANILKVTLPTLYDWRKKGIISAYRIGNKIRFNRQELLDSLIKIDSAS
jgi:excisionase family DNA binding protein